MATTDTTAIDADEYRTQRDEQARLLAQHAAALVEQGDYDTFSDALWDSAHEYLDAHNWFARSYHGPATYGAIVEYAEHGEVYDIQSFVGESVDQTFKQLAFRRFEADVAAKAQEFHQSEEV